MDFYDRLLKLTEKKFAETVKNDSGEEKMLYEQIGVFVCGYKDRKVDILFDVVTHNMDFVLNTVLLLEKLGDYEKYFVVSRVPDKDGETLDMTIYYTNENNKPEKVPPDDIVCYYGCPNSKRAEKLNTIAKIVDRNTANIEKGEMTGGESKI